MISRLNLNYYRQGSNTQNKFTQFDFVEIEQISIHTSYYNIVDTYGSTLHYDTVGINLSPIVLPNGYYTLQSLNKILLGNNSLIVPSLFYKIVRSLDSETFSMFKYSNQTDWNLEQNGIDKTALILNSSNLNKQIYNMSFFCNLITIRFNLINNYSTQRSTNELTTIQTLDFPVTAQTGSYQTIYFNPPNKYAYDGSGMFELLFFTYTNQQIVFNPLYVPLVVLKFSKI